MRRVLFVGQRPDTVDYSDPALPPGFDHAKIEAGIAVGVQRIAERGWFGETCMITPDEAGLVELDRSLKDGRYDCVVVGAGLRMPPKGLAFFEAVVNIVHRASPDIAIAFNTKPEDTADAAARRLGHP